MLGKEENVLGNSRQILQELTGHMPMGLVLCDREGNIAFASSKAVEILEWFHEDPEAVGNLFSVSSWRKIGLAEWIRDCMAAKPSARREIRWVTPAGDKRWVQVIVYPRWDSGKGMGAWILLNDETETKRILNRLKQSEENFRTFFDSSHDILLVVRLDGRILHANETACRKLGYTEAEFMDLGVMQLHFESDQEEAGRIFEAMVQGTRAGCPLPLRTKTGHHLPVETTIRAGVWNGQDVLFAACKDLSLEQEALQKFNRIFDSNPAPMAISTHPDRRFYEVNQAFLEKTGYSEEEVLGKTSRELQLFLNPSQQAEAGTGLQKKGDMKDVPLDIRTKDGRVLHGLFSGAMIVSQGKNHYLTVMTDITELRKYQQQIEHMSYHDALTGLCNRRYFDQALTRIERKNTPASIIIADVNGLKLINDAFGHSTGDQLLVRVAEKIRQACDQDEIVARIGGDEFAVVMDGKPVEEAQARVSQIRRLLSLEQIESMDVSVSIGCDGRGIHGKGIYDVFRHADEYMYQNKLIERASMRSQAVQVIMNTLFEKSQRERAHSERVSLISHRIGRALGLGGHELNELRVAALLHDIGKISIDMSILDKPEKLSPKEFEIVMRHPEVGYKILSTINEYAGLADCVLQHHERWDGTGYPRGLQGLEIDRHARIIAVADAYDAMTAERPYREALSDAEAVAEIRRHAGTQFDPEIAKAAIEHVFSAEGAM